MAAYLLADIPPALRQALSAAAAEQDVSIQNLVLTAMYEHYSLEVPARQRERRYSEQLDQGALQLQIRANTELFEEVKRDAAHTSGTMRSVMIAILNDRFLGPRRRRMTNYTVLVHGKGTDGFVIAGTADANTPKQAVEQVLGKTNATIGYTEGRVGAVPTRSWDPQPFKLVTQPKLELG